MREDGIPTGTLETVSHTDFDFQTTAPIFTKIIDHNFSTTDAVKPRPLRTVAELSLDETTVILESTLPGLQIYTGDFIPEHVGKQGVTYSPRAGIAMEPQYFPDAPNCPAFENYVLRPDETYSETIRYKILNPIKSVRPT